ncbi:MAG: hypothetical protein JO165_06055 [Candidatus Eremiobacteraeota bacterium]|nr:hypothetical protein [Candidatus Eremiobacteraeota bacterium]
MRATVIGILTLSLVACGGGGGGGSSAPPTPVPSGPATATFTVSLTSGGSIQGAKRTPKYISKNTNAIAISVNAAPAQTFPCALSQSTPTCNASLTVPGGLDTFSVVDMDSGGNALSRSTFQQNIPPGSTTAINAVLNGIVSTVDVDLKDHYAPMGAPFTTTVLITAHDPSGAIIIGPGNYQQPITLANSDTSGATTLSETTVTAPSDVVTLRYDGTSYVDPIITSTPSNGMPGNPIARLVPMATATEIAIPSASKTAAGMVVGSDGALWFSESRGMGRVTTGGAITEYPFSGATMGPSAVALGPDGNVWFTGAINNAPPPIGPANNSDVGNIAPNGALTFYTVNTSGYGLGTIAKGPDAKMWFGEGSSLGSVTTTGAFSQVTPTWGFNNVNISSNDLVTGPDNNIWTIGSTAGQLYRYVLGATTATAFFTPPIFDGAAPGSMQPYRIIVGPDNKFYLNSNSLVAKMDTSGTTLATYPFYNIFGAYGQMTSTSNAVWVPLWLNTDNHPMIARIGTNGAYGEFALSTTGSGQDQSTILGALALGADGQIWYTRGAYVGHFSAH